MLLVLLVVLLKSNPIFAEMTSVQSLVHLQFCMCSLEIHELLLLALSSIGKVPDKAEALFLATPLVDREIDIHRI